MLAPTPGNAAVLFLDLQDEIVKNSQTVPLDQLRRAAGVLARLAALHELPVFLSAVHRPEARFWRTCWGAWVNGGADAHADDGVLR